MGEAIDLWSLKESFKDLYGEARNFTAEDPHMRVIIVVVKRVVFNFATSLYSSGASKITFVGVGRSG